MPTATDYRIITPYFDAVALAQYFGPKVKRYNIDLAFIVYKHITDALSWLQDFEIVHNDVSKHTILIEHFDGRYTARLTGFSECTRHNSTSKVGFRHDLANLSSVTLEMLPLGTPGPCCDPQWALLMSRAFEMLIEAREVNAGLEAMSPGYEQTPFRTAVISKTMQINRIFDGKTEVVHLLDFIRIILHREPSSLRSAEVAIKKTIRQEALVQVENGIYCYLHDANKLLHELQADGHAILLDLTPPPHMEARCYQTEHVIEVPISCYEPFGMVNVTQILNLFNSKNIPELLEDFKPRFHREVLGSTDREGHYIDKMTLQALLRRFGIDIPVNSALRPIEQEKVSGEIRYPAGR
jgi:hypothetical protein